MTGEQNKERCCDRKQKKGAETRNLGGKRVCDDALPHVAVSHHSTHRPSFFPANSASLWVHDQTVPKSLQEDPALALTLTAGAMAAHPKTHP